MKKLLKYLIPVIVVAAFWNSTDNSTPYASEAVLADISTIECTNYSSFSKSQSEPCIPRQISLNNAHRVQSAARRATSIQRHSLEFTKAGKIINVGLRHAIKNNCSITYSSLTEPAQRLLYLGRLII